MCNIKCLKKLFDENWLIQGFSTYPWNKIKKFKLEFCIFKKYIFIKINII